MHEGSMMARARPLLILFTSGLALWLAACTPASVVGEAQQAVQSRLPSALRPAAAPAQPEQSAIQLVITRGDLEQEQAIASHDSSVMKDTSTDAYYQKAVQQNQALLTGGVTRIKLANLEWGPITVSGNTATVENYETWSTTYQDGSSDWSRDHNVYTLVKENGAWRIQADDQPGGASSSQPSASGSPRGAPSAAGGRPSAAPSAAASAPPKAGSLAITAPAGSVDAAIQQVVLKGNQEQEQAIASHDSSVMKDTSTDGYYQDLAQTNQDMLDGGVTAIRLINIDWSPATVTGSTAKITTHETWWTRYSDGSTSQSTDRNDYTLVKQTGVWKIQTDDHPDSDLVPGPSGTQPGSPGASTGSSPSPRVPPAPISPAGRGVSRNWSGYAASGGAFTSVGGTWTVPKATSSGSLGADAAWVGIGGEHSRDLIQAGTEETVLRSGRVQYDAWIEMLPQYSHPVPLGIHAG
ncbi:MAG: hypothetical protein KGJ86_20175, partial [Chloroflexota bacterium]|nr:hypothetical protein [Chloroflexota bacterium]